MIEQEVRVKIDDMLRRSGWILDPEHPERNVYIENAVKAKLTSIAAARLGNKKPDYTLFGRGIPIAVLEAKKEGVTLDKALAQATEYAEKIDCGIIFAFNGRNLRSRHLPSSQSLYYNDMEVASLPRPEQLIQYHDSSTNRLNSASERVISSRDELIDLISKWNDLLRTSGMRSGVERFTEFANILFLKLLSEADSDEGLWTNLLKQERHRIVPYINGFVINQLEDRYGSEVISKTQISDGSVLQQIISELNSLRLSSVDEDLKGMAFEHFIQRTTTQNDLGEYFTPRHIVRFMVKLVDPEFGSTVFDPFCGTGGFLVESFRHLSLKSGRSPTDAEQLQTKTIFGQEITSNARIAKMNMILFGDGHSGVTQTNSVKNPPNTKHDIVLSNIPFSQQLTREEILIVDKNAKDGDEACLLRCFSSLAAGGSMAVIVPEGLVVNKNHQGLWMRLLKEARVRVIASLPRGCFAPYTEAATRLVYLTDKDVASTDWFYYARVINDGYTDIRFSTMPRDIDDLQNLLFFYSDSDNPARIPNELKSMVSIVRTDETSNVFAALTNSLWPIVDEADHIGLNEVAILENGTSITAKRTSSGDVPVIAGGRSSPYTHSEQTHAGNVFTVSKSGAYAGYVWWHSGPIWASDSITVYSRDESKFLTSFLYACVKGLQDEIYARQQGTGQPHIYKNHIETIPIPLISVEKQRELVQDFIDALDAYEAQKATLDAAHDHMLDAVKTWE